MADLAAPALTALLLCACLAVGELDTLQHPNAEPYWERIGQRIDELPYLVGGFVGVDSEVTPAAIKLLKPNRLKQRTYMDPASGQYLTLMVVHCKDVRDMLGHYPPNCYPAHGWRREGTQDTTVHLAGADHPARLYEFSQRTDATEERMHILNFFVVPTRAKPIVADTEALDRSTGSRRAAGLGAAQVQILAKDPALLAPDSTVIARFMEAIEPAVREISKGPTSE